MFYHYFRCFYRQWRYLFVDEDETTITELLEIYLLMTIIFANICYIRWYGMNLITKLYNFEIF